MWQAYKERPFSSSLCRFVGFSVGNGDRAKEVLLVHLVRRQRKKKKKKKRCWRYEDWEVILLKGYRVDFNFLFQTGRPSKWYDFCKFFSRCRNLTARAMTLGMSNGRNCWKKRRLRQSQSLLKLGANQLGLASNTTRGLQFLLICPYFSFYFSVPFFSHPFFLSTICWTVDVFSFRKNVFQNRCLKTGMHFLKGTRFRTRKRRKMFQKSPRSLWRWFVFCFRQGAVDLS